MSGSPRTAAGRALLAREDYNSRSFPLITAEAILAIEAEAATPGESRTLVEALDALEREFLDALPPAGHPIVRGIFQRLPDRLRAALAEVPVIPDAILDDEAKDPATPPESR